VIEGSLQGTVTLVADRNTLIGSVLDPPRHYQIRLLRDTVHVVSEIDPSMYPAERAPSPGGVPPKPPPPPPAPPPPVKKPPR
jgi:hypothetical protein